MVINLDESDDILLGDGSGDRIKDFAIGYLHMHFKNDLDELRLSPRLREPYTILDEIRRAYENFEIFPEIMDEEELSEELTEFQLKQMLEDEKNEGKRLGYQLEFVKQGITETITSVSSALAPDISSCLKNLRVDGKLNVIYEGKLYEVPVSISKGLVVGDSKLEKLVLGRPELLGDVEVDPNVSRCDNNEIFDPYLCDLDDDI